MPTLCATYPEEARQVLRRGCRNGGPVVYAPYHGEPDAAPLPLLSDELRAVLPLPGAHQADNASLAVAALSHVDGPLRPFCTIPTSSAKDLPGHAGQADWNGLFRRPRPISRLPIAKSSSTQRTIPKVRRCFQRG